MLHEAIGRYRGAVEDLAKLKYWLAYLTIEQVRSHTMK